MVRKVVFLLVVVALAAAIWQTGATKYLTLTFLKANLTSLQETVAREPVLSGLGYFFIYVLVTGLSVPGASVLTLAGGAIFGFAKGLTLASFGSVIGATVAFLMSRYLLQETVQRRFGQQLVRVNAGVRRDGKLYLFALRLVPVFPYFLINLVMGVTAIPIWTYFWVSQVAMLPGTAVFVNAGLQISQVDSIRGLLSFDMILAFSLMGILPFASKRLLGWLKSRPTG